MGGVIQFVRRRADAPSIDVEASIGSQSTRAMSMFAAIRGSSLAIDLLDTAGYVLVDPSQRGAVDRRADASHSSFDLTVERDLGFIRGSYFTESRNNGTPLQTNDTTIRAIAGGFNRGALVARGWATDQDYAQTFSAIAANRNSERLTVDQRVPSRSGGASVQWSRALAHRNAIVAGVEGLQVTGSSKEQQFAANGTITNVNSSGRQRTAGIFLEDVLALRDVSMTAGLRFDSWRNDTAWSPRLAILYRPSQSLAFTASAYRAFRAPTLNELYRGFRVGNVVTLANESLAPERTTAFELGARARWVRATLFWMNLDDVISNVTLSTTPALITRQRQNVASSRSRGVELEGEWTLWRNARASSGYLFCDSVDLNDRRLPQVPKHTASGQIAWNGVSTFAIQARWSSMQFDDDLNQFRLRSYFVADAFFAHPVANGVDVTLAVENIFDRRIEAGATPVITLGQPRSIRAGVRLSRERRGSKPRS